MTSEPGKQTIAIHILPNIARRKHNQTLKSGQFITYKVRNIFLEKLYTQKRWVKLVPGPFMKNRN